MIIQLDDSTTVGGLQNLAFMLEGRGIFSQVKVEGKKQILILSRDLRAKEKEILLHLEEVVEII